MKGRYDRHDLKLFNAVRRFKHLHDGCIDIITFGCMLEVYCYGRVMFRYSRRNGYWEAATWGCRKRWWVDKVNACLHAVNATVRLYDSGHGFRIVSADGRDCGFCQSFNSEYVR